MGMAIRAPARVALPFVEGEGGGLRLGVLSAAVLSFAVCGTLAQERVTQADLLRRVINVARLTSPPPADEQTLLFSDRGREGAEWAVLAEVDGPGAFTRLWFGESSGEIRIELDREVVIDTTIAGLFSGQTAPFVEPLVLEGRTSYFPLGFSRSGQILCRGRTGPCQISAVRFSAGTTVERFTRELTDDAQKALADVRQALTHGLSEKQLCGAAPTLPVAVAEELAPDDVLRESLAGAGTLRALYLALTDKANPRELYALHRCVLRIYFDGEDTPSVEAPLTDFFGSGFDLVPFVSLVVGTGKGLSLPLPDRRLGENRFMYCYFPMPYRTGLRVEIHNLNESKKPIGLLLHLRAETRPPAEDALRFYARFRREDPCRKAEYEVLETSGPGRLVGCVLNVDCPRAEWWGAGGERLSIDGQKPWRGTGTDHYAGDVDGLHLRSAPLAGVTRAAAFGKNSLYRWYVMDSVGFQQGLRFRFENVQTGGLKDTTYSSVVYWYAPAGAASWFKPLKRADLELAGLRIPGAIEIEGHVAGVGWGRVIDEPPAEGVEFSGKRAVQISTAEVVRIRIPCATERRVLLKLRTHPGRTFETITVTDDAGKTVGVARYDRDAEGVYELGALTLKKGDTLVGIQSDRPVVLDCWIIGPATGP